MRRMEKGDPVFVRNASGAGDGAPEGKIRFCLAALCLAILILCCPAYVFADPGVYDLYGLLDGTEKKLLEEHLEKIHEQYDFDAAVLITGNVREDERTYAAEFMREYDIGSGSVKNGMCLFHQPDSRTITVVFRGEAQDAFDAGVRDVILDDCAERLKISRYYSGYEAALGDLEKGLARFSRGKKIRPIDMGGPGALLSFLIYFAASCLVMAIPASCLILYQRSRMKTRKPQPNADLYAPEEGVELAVERDLYMRTLTTRTRISQPSSHQGGGGGGSFSTHGETFSGSSRKY